MQKVTHITCVWNIQSIKKKIKQRRKQTKPLGLLSHSCNPRIDRKISGTYCLLHDSHPFILPFFSLTLPETSIFGLLVPEHDAVFLCLRQWKF